MAFLPLLLSGCSSTNPISATFDCKYDGEPSVSDVNLSCISNISLSKANFDVTWEKRDKGAAAGGLVKKKVTSIEKGVEFPVSFSLGISRYMSHEISFSFKVSDDRFHFHPFSTKVTPYQSPKFSFKTLAEDEPPSEPVQEENEPPSESVQEENEMSQVDFTMWYDEGYSSMMDSSPELLYKWGIANAFGATGNPVESKMLKFCRGFVQGWKNSKNYNYFDLSKEQKLKAEESWDRGCAAAGMTLRLP